MAELNVSRKSIEGLLSLSDPTMKGKILVIPEYQRPYRWDKNMCDILWNDLKNFYEDHRDDEREYFLGSIVTCSDENNNINIIDGQQRITSLLLLLRAFYHKLEEQLSDNQNDDEVKGLMGSIEPCIWKVNPMTKKVSDKKDKHIRTLVATDDDIEDFNLILETGKAREKSRSYYADNYSFFLDLCNEYAKTHLTGWKEFCLFILQRCIVLPIECTDLDSALTIFGTLNDRGLPLADSDIFKAELYKIAKSKSEFNEQWKELEQDVKNAGFNLDYLFRYYMFIDRAKHGDTSKEIGLRSYYSGKGNKYSILKEEGFFEHIKDLGEFWVSIYSYGDTFCDDEGLRYVQCLFAYPNDYWKYPVSVFYYKNKNIERKEFKEKLTVYLKKLLSFMFVRFIEAPTVNDVKPYIFKFCIETYKDNEIDCSSYKVPADLKTRINDFSKSRMEKALLLLNTYLFDPKQTLVCGKLEIEHIFPRSWQDTNYNGWNKKDAETHLEMFGNKMIFEKKLNIQAGNGYFGIKKKKYEESKLKEVLAMSQLPQNDWLKEDIEKRNEMLIDRLCEFFYGNLFQPVMEEREISIELKSGEETYVLYKITNVCTGAVRYRLEGHTFDMSSPDFLSKKMIDWSAEYDDIQDALHSIDKKAFFGGIMSSLEEDIKSEINRYISGN